MAKTLAVGPLREVAPSAGAQRVAAAIAAPIDDPVGPASGRTQVHDITRRDHQLVLTDAHDERAVRGHVDRLALDLTVGQRHPDRAGRASSATTGSARAAARARRSRAPAAAPARRAARGAAPRGRPGARRAPPASRPRPRPRAAAASQPTLSPMPTTTAARRDGSSGAATPSASTPASFRPPESRSFGHLRSGSTPATSPHRLARGEGDRPDRAVEDAAGLRPQEDRAQQRAAGGCLPRPTQAPSPGRLVVGDEDGAGRRARSRRGDEVRVGRARLLHPRHREGLRPAAPRRWGGGRCAHRTNIRPRAPEDPDRQPG